MEEQNLPVTKEEFVKKVMESFPPAINRDWVNLIADLVIRFRELDKTREDAWLFPALATFVFSTIKDKETMISLFITKLENDRCREFEEAEKQETQTLLESIAKIAEEFNSEINTQYKEFYFHIFDTLNNNTAFYPKNIDFKKKEDWVEVPPNPDEFDEEDEYVPHSTYYLKYAPHIQAVWDDSDQEWYIEHNLYYLYVTDYGIHVVDESTKDITDEAMWFDPYKYVIIEESQLDTFKEAFDEIEYEMEEVDSDILNERYRDDTED